MRVIPAADQIQPQATKGHGGGWYRIAGRAQHFLSLFALVLVDRCLGSPLDAEPAVDRWVPSPGFSQSRVKAAHPRRLGSSRCRAIRSGAAAGSLRPWELACRFFRWWS
jgi:hypothetical protein